MQKFPVGKSVGPFLVFVQKPKAGYGPLT